MKQYEFNTYKQERVYLLLVLRTDTIITAITQKEKETLVAKVREHQETFWLSSRDTL